MIYLVNFFVRNTEAISRQVEEARATKKDPIITCCYFLNQKPLRFEDIKDNIWIFPKWLYPVVAFIILIISKSDVHIFEDEPSTWRLIALNFRKRKIFVSLFKDINEPLVKYLNKFNFISTIIVEDEISKEFVAERLRKKIPLMLVYPPSLWPASKKPKTQFNKNNHLLFASWNGGTKETIIERGIGDLSNLVKKTGCSCTIILRDHETKYLTTLIENMGLKNNINLLYPENIKQVKNAYSQANYVVLIPRKPVMKYTPNSIIDGLCLGKPCIITDCLRFSSTVTLKNLGLVFDRDNIESFKFPTKNTYQCMIEKCCKWSQKNIPCNYKKVFKRIYAKN